MSEPKDIKTMAGATLPLHMSVHYISFSAHSDFLQTSEFIDQLKTNQVVWSSFPVPFLAMPQPLLAMAMSKPLWFGQTKWYARSVLCASHAHASARVACACGGTFELYSFKKS